MKKYILIIALLISLIVVPVSSAGKTREYSEREVKNAICTTFGKYCDEALRVASCETGGTFSVWSRNGQYENIFQMGTWERKTYGWHTVGSSPWVAARAAYRYFLASYKEKGYRWHPWSCKP